MKLSKDITIVISVKLVFLTMIWFFFVHSHIVAHGSQETSLHILSDNNRK